MNGELRKRQPRILVGTLYCGENEFEESTEMLRAQSYKHWDQVVFRDLENKKAHDALYREFMNRSREYDLFLKLDADMVFRSRDSLEKLVDLFVSFPELDHLRTPVRDWYSGIPIPALHLFSNRARWERSEEKVFVDGPPSIPGRSMVIDVCFVNHSPNPSRRQAYLFGMHRAVKAVQPGSTDFRRGQAMMQWNILVNTWKHFERSRDPRLGLCILGADKVLRGEAAHNDYVTRKVETSVLDDYSQDQLYNILVKRWGGFIRREFMHKRLIGLRLLRSLLVRPPNLGRVVSRQYIRHRRSKLQG